MGGSHEIIIDEFNVEMQDIFQRLRVVVGKEGLQINAQSGGNVRCEKNKECFPCVAGKSLDHVVGTVYNSNAGISLSHIKSKKFGSFPTTLPWWSSK